VGWEKGACWSTKVAISLKCIKIEEPTLFQFFGSPPYFYRPAMLRHVLTVVMWSPCGDRPLIDRLAERIDSTESHVILGGGVAVSLLLSAHPVVILAIAQLFVLPCSG